MNGGHVSGNSYGNNNSGNGFTHNSAENSTVGIQAETVHNSSVYIVNPDASPQEKYAVGVRFLEDGIPSRARDMISDAIAHGYDSAEVRFHWVLALLSTRAYHELGPEEIRQLQIAAGNVPSHPEGEWKDALRVTFDLLALLSAADGQAAGETARVLDRLQSLSPPQRNAILRHLDLVLIGGLKDGLWAESREWAERERFAHDRTQRVWAYFEPDPIGPRALEPRPSGADAARKALPLRTGLFVAAVAFLWVLAMFGDPVPAVLALPVGIGAGVAAARFGPEWWYRERRVLMGDQEPRVPHPNAPDPGGEGFTNRLRHSFDHYFGVRVPHGFATPDWLARTAPLRAGLVAEISFLYRESRVGVDRLNWLVRHLAEDARDRQNAGTLFDDAGQNRAPASSKALAVAALAVLGLTALYLVGAAFSSNVPLALLAAAGGGYAGRAAAHSWLDAWGEDRRFAEETREYQEQLAARGAAFRKWKSYLDATRPTELEMETWLTCDKTLFVDEALRHYRLTWRDLITHTILITPARPYKRGRVRGGPWRYSRYGFRLFLITQDGVREISSESDFTDGKRGENEQRSNYRFDALSSVQVTERANVGYDLELVLTNGPARNIRVKDADTHQLAPDENAQEISEINLNAAGFLHTFHLLEGIAADGKGWIERNNPRNLPPFRPAD